MALGILATVLIALGALMLGAAQRTRESAALSYRSAAAGNAQAWIQGLPWDSLPGTVGCTDDTIGQFPYSRCVTLETPSSNLRRMTVAITPTGALQASPDTVVIDRNKPRSTSTLYVN